MYITNPVYKKVIVAQITPNMIQMINQQLNNAYAKKITNQLVPIPVFKKVVSQSPNSA